jgi:hypothetical protein
MTITHADQVAINVRGIPKVPAKIHNPEKMATQSTQDEEKQNKNTTLYLFDTTIRKQRK